MKCDVPIPPRSDASLGQIPESDIQPCRFNPLMENLRLLAERGRAMPGAQSLPRHSRQTPTQPATQSLDQQVEARCSVAFAGLLPALFPGGALTRKGSGTLHDHPIPNGMTDTLAQMTKIVVVDYQKVQNPQFWRLPKLLRRVRHLLRVHYDCVLTKKRHPEVIYCDWETVWQIGLRLHGVRLYLQLDEPARLKAVMAGGFELEAFIFDDELDIGPWRKKLGEMRESLDAEKESYDDDRSNVLQFRVEADEDLAAHLLSSFYADVSVAFIVHESSTSSKEEKRWARKATKRLVHWATNDEMRDGLGDALTESLQPIYCSKPLLIKFGQAGGLASLFGDWIRINSTSQNLCEETFKTLPDEAWENQTKGSLNALTLQMQRKVASAGSRIANNPIMVNAFWDIYKRYGLRTFHAASRHMTYDDNVLFYYLYHRINKEKMPLNSKAEWQALLTDFVNIPRTTDRRYHWLALSISGKWHCIEYYGCCAEDCPEKKELLKLRAVRVLGVHDPEIEARLDEWARARACSGCLETAYCSPSCQKAHWKSGHKSECERKERAT
ncbi:hypothetical protein C8J56DRAFT_1169896 [Mycena floridula]|nr:hypothetical protein C8J56DRAFT_1169896 [Mycena floridula]